jgi:hypothetical protein
MHYEKNSDTTVGKGIYGSPLINICENFTQNFKVGGDEYRLVFQCRVRPDKIKISSGATDYWVVNNTEDIRPYRILISNESTLKENKHIEKMK